MKRSLSVFLSLVLLVSALVVPMTVSAAGTEFNATDSTKAGAQNGYTCTLEKFTNNSGASSKYIHANNLLKDLTPKLYLKSKSADKKEVSYSNRFLMLADEDLVTNSDISLNSQAFVDDGTKDESGNLTAFANDYVPTGVFDFGNEITTYVDIVYELDNYYSISQIQHFTTNSTTNSRTGIYQIYAAKTEDELFEEKSLLINYQIKSDDTDNTKTEKENSQDFNFTGNQPTAHYFAFRVLCPVAGTNVSANAKDIRITQLAVYGTKSDKIFDVKVNRALDNNIGIIYEPDTDCKLDAAEEGQNVKFKLAPETIPDGADVTVKYGDDEIIPVGDVYTIPVERDKVLHIIPSHVPTQFSKSDAATYFNATDPTRVSDGLSPVIFVTYDNNGTKMRTQVGHKENYETNIPALSNGDISAKKDISVGDYFNGTNGYTTENYTNDFNFNNNNITNYVDIIYDLGCTVNVDKIQHFANDGVNSLGLYQVYASEDVNNLFEQESWVLNYQNKKVQGASNYYGCQQHEFAARPARFVAFRILCPVTVPSGTANTLRIHELAIYGTKVGTDPGYTVTPVPDFNNWITGGSETGNVGENNLLKLNNLTVNGMGDSQEVELKVSTEQHSRLNDGVYGGSQTGGLHADIGLVKFYDLDNNQFKNGYNISREANGNITFEQTGEITDYVCMTYDLGDYYKLKEFQLYSVNGDRSYNYILKMQAYEVYVGTDKETLYKDDNRVAKYDNYFNVYGQVIKFTNHPTGCYLGVKVLMPSMYKEDPNNATVTNNYIRLSEIAAFGDVVGELDEGSQLRPAELTSGAVYIWEKDGKSTYINEKDSKEYTAARLTVGYKSPVDDYGYADATQIVLQNGGIANVIERNVIAIARSRYNAYTGLDIHNAIASKTYSTVTSEEHPVKNYFKSEYVTDDYGNVIDEGKYRMAYGALNLYNISENNSTKGFVVRGRVVYEYEGETYVAYSDIVGANEDVSAQSSYIKRCNKIADDNGGSFENYPSWFNGAKYGSDNWPNQQ